ncbi:MAG: alpha-L-fucosidase, partial [Terriglobia bacterium]
ELSKRTDWSRGPSTADPDYRHAPQEAIDAFKDLKFGIRIHWGLYCLIGSHESWGLAGANREFWNIYNVLHQFFNPTDFDAGSWMDLFERAGIKFFTFTTKHHEGFCMWPTTTTQQCPRLTAEAFNEGCEHLETVTNNYSIIDSPYKKDIVRAVVDAGRKKGMSVGLYYSHIDWHDPAFAWDPFNFYYDPKFTRQSNPQRWQTFIDHEREQVRELMTNYGPIDVVDFDIGWPKSADGDIADIARMARKLQPNAIMRSRGIGAYGDYYTPERQIPGGPSKGLWKVIYPCGTSFSYIPSDIYHPAEWVLETLISIVAKGGNFEVGFGPMPNGVWAPEAVQRLAYVGDWLKVNGEAIYKTRPRKVFKEGSDIWFTATKDGRYVYAISTKWPGSQLRLESVKASPGSPIFMIGVQQPLKWSQQGESLVVDIPPEVAEHQPCRQAFAFKIQVRSA